MSEKINRLDESLSTEVLSDDSLWYGCLFCRTGKEDKTIQQLTAMYPDVKAISPRKMRYRRHGKEAVEEQVPLFPGYIFFRTIPEDERTYHFAAFEDALRLLCYNRNNWRLIGADEAMARTFFEYHGVVGFSKAYYEGDRICIAEGFLKQYEGSIIRVNHRAKTAEIRVEFQGKIITMWLGFELIQPTSKS